MNKSETNAEDQRKINLFYTHIPKFIYNAIMNSGDTEELRENLIRNLNFQKNEKILEVCCGTGLNFKYYPKGPIYHAIDINPRMLSKANIQSKKDQKDISFYCGDARELPFENDYFDTAFITFGLSAIPDNRTAFSQIERVVRSGGKIGVLDFENSSHHPKWGGQVRLNLGKLILNSNAEVTHFTSSDITASYILSAQ
jgi:ubiquinone/menaquinone biosynthesis C-methylase UbiE